MKNVSFSIINSNFILNYTHYKQNTSKIIVNMKNFGMSEIKLLDDIPKTVTELYDGPNAKLCSLSLSDDGFGAYRQKSEYIFPHL